MNLSIASKTVAFLVQINYRFRELHKLPSLEKLDKIIDNRGFDSLQILSIYCRNFAVQFLAKKYGA